MLDFQITDQALNSEARRQGFHFDQEKVKEAATEIKNRFRPDGYKGMIDDTYYKGVGVAVDPSWDMMTLLQKADLNWKTETSLLNYGKQQEFCNINQQAVYREGTGELFGIVSDTWQPYQNVEVVEAFNYFCKEAGIEMERLGHLKNGRLVFASAVVNDSWEVMGSNDIIAARLLLTNSHEYGVGLTAKLNAVRLVCCNGITRKVSVGQHTIGHNQSFSKEKVRLILESSKNSFANLGLLIDELAQVEISNQDAKDFLIETLGSKGEQNEIKSFYEQNKLVREAYYAYANHNSVGAHLETSQGNAWELLNCVTEQINHNSRSVGETHVNSLWHGHKAQLQTKVLSAMEHEFLKRQNKQAQTVGVRAY